MVGGANKWHVDRSVPISVLFALLVQTAGVVWWASDQSSINRAQAQEIAELSEQAAKTTETFEERNLRITRLEIQVQNNSDKLDQILRILQMRSGKPL